VCVGADPPPARPHDRAGRGIAHHGKRWIASRPAFLLPVRVLGKLFRRLFLARFAVALSHARCRSHKNVGPNRGKSLLVQSAAKFQPTPHSSVYEWLVSPASRKQP
jgi:hypothetical protein